MSASFIAHHIKFDKHNHVKKHHCFPSEKTRPLVARPLQVKMYLVSLVTSLVLVNVVHCQKLDDVICEVNDCSECYNYLVYDMLKNGTNQYNLQRVFYPPDDATPVSVIVYYDYGNETGYYINSTKRKVWFWTSSSFYHIQPVGVLQFLSLFFTDPSLRVSYLNITLDSECESASDDYMQLLTQRVIASRVIVTVPGRTNQSASNFAIVTEYNLRLILK